MPEFFDQLVLFFGDAHVFALPRITRERGNQSGDAAANKIPSAELFVLLLDHDRFANLYLTFADAGSLNFEALNGGSEIPRADLAHSLEGCSEIHPG